MLISNILAVPTFSNLEIKTKTIFLGRILWLIRNRGEGVLPQGVKDNYEDLNVMQFLKDGEAVSTWSIKKRDRVL